MADNDPSPLTSAPESDSADLHAHHYLTQAIHTLDLLNSQLGVAGAALVNLYHLQRQREAATQPPPGYTPAPYPYPPAGNYQAPPANYPPQPAPPQGYYQGPPQQPYPPQQPPPQSQPYYPPNSTSQNQPQNPQHN